MSGTSTTVEFEGLTIANLPTAKALLQNSNLPFEDCDRHIENFVGIFDGQKMLGMGGIEVIGKLGLIRSIVVDQAARGQGLGSTIVDYLHEQARSKGLTQLYLLTETAQSYFLGKGYDCLVRDDVPVEIRSTDQFRSLCPASAQAMRIQL